MILYLYLYYLLRENMYFTTFIYSLIIVCFPLVPCVILFKAISVLYIYMYTLLSHIAYVNIIEDFLTIVC